MTSKHSFLVNDENDDQWDDVWAQLASWQRERWSMRWHACAIYMTNQHWSKKMSSMKCHLSIACSLTTKIMINEMKTTLAYFDVLRLRVILFSSENNWFLVEINNEVKARRSFKSQLLEKTRVMSYNILQSSNLFHFCLQYISSSHITFRVHCFFAILSSWQATLSPFNSKIRSIELRSLKLLCFSVLKSWRESSMSTLTSIHWW